MKKPRVATPGLPFHIDHADNLDDIESAARNQGFPQSGTLTAPFLDRLADAELQHGHHARAEHLSSLAAEMREAGR